MGRKVYVPEGSPSKVAWRSVRGDALHQAGVLLKSVAVAAFAWWLPRWVVPTLVVTACGLMFLLSAGWLLHSVKEWVRIRRHVRRQQIDELVDYVHDR